jgi:hypothetical protein
MIQLLQLDPQQQKSEEDTLKVEISHKLILIDILKDIMVTSQVMIMGDQIN